MATVKKVTVDESFIKEAHKAACGEWKKKIETKFPDVFKKLPLAFEDGYRISSHDASGPLIIGKGLAPSGLEGRCLVVTDGYEMKVLKFQGRQVLTLFRK
jgi:hypothetical protein